MCYGQCMKVGTLVLLSAFVAVSVALGACKKSANKGDDDDGIGTPNRGAKDTAPTASGAPAADGTISWIEDDYAGALAKAKTQDKPLVIDMWAPWCHTCLSMQHTTMVDDGLKAMAGRFVWLELNTDKATNAEVLARFRVEVWPTYFIVSPDSEAIQARFQGAASVKQFREFLVQGEKGHREARAAAGKLTRNSVGWTVRAGDQAAVAGDYEAAAVAYGSALGKAPRDWARTADVLVAKITALTRAKAWTRCGDLAVESADKIRIGNTASAADFAYYANACADKLVDRSRADLVRRRMMESIDRVLQAPDAALSMDDRSEALRIQREIAIALKQDERAVRLAERQRAVLDEAAAAARTPLEAMTYNWPRAEVYAYLGISDELVADLKKSVQDLPNQYDPPHRLAWIYSKIGKHDEALEMADKALALVSGPRKALIQSLIADIHEARGDLASAKKALEVVVDIYENLPEGQRNQSALDKARKKLEQPPQ